MLPKLDNTSAAPIVATALLQGTSTVADPRLEAMARLEQITIPKPLPSQLTTQLVKAAALSPEQSLALPISAPSNKTTLSAAALLINALLQSSADAVPETKPLLAQAITDTAQLAKQLSTQLHQAVDKSGVFYESHLQQWSNGERNLAQVQGEPQNQANTLPAAAVQWVPVQLTTLEQQRFVWQGQAWPGQDMQWQVKEDNSESSLAPNGDKEKGWNSVIQLNFPSLGNVSVTLRLVGEHVRVELRTQDDETAASLKNQGGQLAQSLAASGTQLDGFTVQHDELT